MCRRMVALLAARLAGCSIVLVWFALFFVPTGASAQVSDTTPPQLQSLTISPASIDVSTVAQTVTVTMNVTDDLSGVDGVSLRFMSPSGGQFRDPFFTRIAGTPLNGTWQSMATFPQSSEAGTWRVEFVVLRDVTTNSVHLDTATLQAAGFPTDLTVASAADTSPPVLTSLTISPANIDVSTAAQTVTVTMNVTDDLSGVNSVSLRFMSPSGGQLRAPFFTRIAGTPLNGTWQGTATLPRFSEAGTWRVEFVILRDVTTNNVHLDTATLQAAGHPTDLSVMSSPSDTSAPLLNGLLFVPTFIDTSAGVAGVSVTMNVADDLSGVNSVSLRFMSPSGGQVRAPFFTRIAGTPLNGTWQGTATLPQFSEAGTWRVEFVILHDVTTNSVHLDTATLQAAGFATNLVVILPSLVVDDIVTGGTVMDLVFGSRAQVTFPPGALSTPTNVAIDVFESPLDIPTPVGFLGPGTRFVNINLSPPPAMPFPSPGLTLVLPLANTMTPGSVLALYRVDAATGSLVPALDTGGLPVTGTVDAPDGLSATFIGVARLSTVVGLIPGFDTDDDNDGHTDEEEVAAGSDPLDPDSTPEVCDGSDNDLDGSIDESFADADGDGRANCVDADDDNDGDPDGTDCQPLNAGVHHGASEIPGNGIDDNCNGTPDEFADSLQIIKAELENAIADNPGTPIADKIEDALAKVQAAIGKLARRPDRQGALGEIEGAVGDLEAAVKDGVLPDTDLLDRLAGLAHVFAAAAIEEAIARLGKPSEIALALHSLAVGDAHRAAGAFKDAVSKYKDAVSKAEGA